MAADNPTLAPRRIHGELLMLGFDVSEQDVSRWMAQTPRDPKLTRRWRAFLHNHRGAIRCHGFFLGCDGHLQVPVLLLYY